ncbi:pro-sigmaK processing inhibitor BofA family protein [Paenibacillus sp. YYML68]|uniref:pro-sigmaK processing inhibitor BofA family protein n=1 Tax=Paenibacillus sp. YYML68 TaxID=2909250 RepID=UPI002492FB8E|nr:pro-sigmaK processing inhibitor BofA family protein [Paenibacillus sp. YYML68]
MKLYLLWGMLIGSAGLLVVMLLRNRQAFQWFGMFSMQLVFAAVLLYLINLLTPYTHFELPLNAVTIGVVGVLGVPGLAALTALKLWVIG